MASFGLYGGLPSAKEGKEGKAGDVTAPPPKKEGWAGGLFAPTNLAAKRAGACGSGGRVAGGVTCVH
jgi:hypothetical protein